MAIVQNGSAEIRPHVHVPHDSLKKYLNLIKAEDLSVEIYFGSKNFDRLSRNDIVRLKKSLSRTTEISIHAPFMDLSPGAVDPKIRDITMRRFSTVLDFAEILKPRVIVFHSGYDRWKYDNRVDIWLEGSLKTWKPLNKRAADAGVTIAIENIFEDDPGNLILLAKEINSRNFGLCFDTGHFNLFSTCPLHEWIGLTKQYIAELHLHDNLRNADHHLAIGEGDFDFQTLFRELEGVDCVYTLEAHTVREAKISLERLKFFLQK